MIARTRPGRCALLVLAAALVSGGAAVPATAAAPEPDGLGAVLDELATLPDGAGTRVVVVSSGPGGRPTVAVLEADGSVAGRAALARRTARPGVVSVEVDTRVGSSATADPLRPRQWNARDLEVGALWAAPQVRTVTVAVLDSGVDSTHPDLQGAVLTGVDLVRGGGGGTDRNGHGTHVAGIVAAQVNGVGVVGLAPRARVLPITVLDDDGTGFASVVAQGIVRAVDLGAEVVNLSLGSDVPSTAVAEAVSYAQDRGVLVVAAAGNARQQGDPVQYPAALPGVLAVASSTQDGVSAASSSTGPHVQLTAPGEPILSTVPGGWAWSIGTSMAAPHVAAAAAVLLAARADLTADAVHDALVSTARDIETPGRDASTGAGLVQPVQALAAVGVRAVARPTPAQGSPGMPRDLDADARTDLLTVHQGNLVRYESSATGGFGSRTPVGGGWAAMDLVIAAGDWDGDGRQDLIARTRTGSRLLLYAGNGRGGFASARQIGSGWGGFDVVVAPSDWDGDGTPDLVARRSLDGALVLYPGTGRGGFAPPRPVASGVDHLEGLVVLGDWDNDGAPDLAQRDAAGRLVMHPGDGTGGVARPRVIGTGWSGTQLTGPGDWDGDRRPDLLSVAQDGAMRLYPSDGTGGFTRARVIGSGWAPYRLAV